MVTQPPPPPSSEVRPGEIFAGRYRIEKLLGAGGYGRVYRATQLPGGQLVALKTIFTVYDDGAARFAREAAIAQKLKHPNTVRLFDFGKTERGQPFLVLELLQGESLESMIERSGPMPAATALKIISQVLMALMEAHGFNIIHRDIKPANIFITSHAGAPLFVKMLDFGLAKDLKGALSDNPYSTIARPLTQTGEVMGTVSYMAPEQVTGGLLTPATDLYAVGLVLAELIHGVPLYDGASAMGIALAQASPKPTEVPATVAQSIAGPIVARAIEKNVSRRYQTAAQMLADVEVALRHATAPPAPNRGISRAMIALGGAGVGLLVLISVMATLLLSRGCDQPKKPPKSAAASASTLAVAPKKEEIVIVASAPPTPATPARTAKKPAATGPLDYQAILKRLGSEGWTLHQTEMSRQILWTMSNVNCVGTAQFLEMDGGAAAMVPERDGSALRAARGDTLITVTLRRVDKSGPLYDEPCSRLVMDIILQ